MIITKTQTDSSLRRLWSAWLIDTPIHSMPLWKGQKYNKIKILYNPPFLCWFVSINTHSGPLLISICFCCLNTFGQVISKLDYCLLLFFAYFQKHQFMMNMKTNWPSRQNNLLICYFATMTKSLKMSAVKSPMQVINHVYLFIKFLIS